MDWLTKQEILAAARKSEQSAIDYSYLHWHQILTATKREILACYDYRALPDAGYCALCQRHKNRGILLCYECSLGKIERCLADSTWWDAATAFEKYIDNDITCRQFRKKAQPMLDLIGTLGTDGQRVDVVA